MHTHGPGDSHHDHAHATGRRVGWALALTASLMVLEFVGGWWTNSLALMADAGHMLSDAAALAAALWAIRRSVVPPTPQRTFGERRAETLVALFNGATLLLVAGGILHESWERFDSPEPIKAGPMFAIASIGLVANLVGLLLLHRDRDSSLNLQGAWQHVIGDALGSVCAMLAAAGVWWRGWTLLDPIASLIVTILIFFGAFRLLRQTVSVLMEHAPESVDVLQVRNTLLDTEGVQDVHCLHVWTIATGFRAMTAHIVHNVGESPTMLLERLHEKLGTHFPLEHVTLQLEPVGYSRCHGDTGWCRLETPELSQDAHHH